MKVRCRRCDICEVEMDNNEHQYWLRKLRGPIVKSGRPQSEWMRKLDICKRCWEELYMQIQVKIRSESNE